MNRTLWVAASGMEAQSRNTDNIANNIANVNTTGFKRSAVRFQDMFYETTRASGAATDTGTTPAGIQMGSGVRVASVSKVFTQGSLTSTSSELDVAIEGDGFFQVSMPDGTTAYTRNGNFHRDADGTIVTIEGYEVVGFPAIDTTATQVTITSDGTVTSVIEQGTDKQTINNGRIQMARFTNPEGMHYLGSNLLQESEASGAVQTGNPGENGFGGISQYSLEGSNVESVQEMVDMIAAQRAYELNSKSINTADSMMQQVAQLKS